MQKVNINQQVKAQKHMRLINVELIFIAITGEKVSGIGLGRCLQGNVIFKSRKQMCHDVRI